MITDADDREITLEVNDAGNFTYSRTDLVMPYRAKVIYNGQERAMVTPQMSGDCNGCHTQDGTEGAPGRILLPM